MKCRWIILNDVSCQAHFSQIRVPGLPTLPSGLPGYHPGTPRLAPHQLYFGQGTPGMMPPQPAGYSFRPQLLPGMRAGVGPNFVMPYQLQRQGQQGQRMGMRPGGNHQQMQQQQVLYCLHIFQHFPPLSATQEHIIFPSLFCYIRKCHISPYLRSVVGNFHMLILLFHMSKSLLISPSFYCKEALA